MQVKTVTKLAENAFRIQLTSNHVAPFVWLEATGYRGHFSDNGFTMYMPSWSVDFIAWDSVTVEQLRKALTVKSLMDIY